MSVQYGGDKITFADGSSTSSGYTGFKNRIINGAMVIDQRYGGSSTTLASGTTRTLDRWTCFSALDSKYSIQQNAGSVTPPAGYVNYLGATSLAATTPATEDVYLVRQYIEGFNVADLAWGTASAKTITLSFWVRSSLTGTFGGALKNGAGDYSYPFTYTISQANTWEYETITVPGSTSGTWLTTNGLGLSLVFSLGTGSFYAGSAGSWSNNSYFTATGSTNVVGTNGATWYVTGVQVEVGSSSTTFEYRPYGTELNMCQRYYQKVGGGLGQGGQSSTIIYWGCVLPVTMRTSPSLGQTAVNVFSRPGVDVWIQSSTGLTGSSSSPQGIYTAFTNHSGVTSQSPYVYAVSYAGNPSYVTCEAEI
jgi:hypothetical protein